MSVKQRIQLDFNKDRVTEIDRLVSLTGSSTRKEYFEQCLTLMEWAITEVQAGRIIVSRDDMTDSYKELILSAFSNIKHNSSLTGVNND